MGIFKKSINYKDLYETEKHNRQMYEKRYREKEKQYQDLQKDKGIGELKKQEPLLQYTYHNFIPTIITDGKEKQI